MKKLITAFVAAVCLAAPAWALDAPKGDVILVVKGAIANANVDGTAAFDRDMLAALPGRKASMETPWTKGKVEFSGPLLREVLKAAGAEGHMLKVRALNDYAAEVPVEDAKFDVILADHQDGEVMSVRDKGPLMVVYPFDENKDLYNELYFSRSVWQIKEIEVVE